MTTCCDTGVGFPTATLMEQLGTNHPLVWKEICGIQQAILSAASICSLPNSACVTVPATTPMTWVSSVTGVTVVNGGSGYVIDRPGVRFLPPAGSTVVPASGSVTTNGGSILSISVSNGGSGYGPVNSQVNVSSLAGQGAILTPHINSSTGIGGIDIVDGGSGYSVGDSIYGVRARPYQLGMSDAIITVTMVSVTGRILDVTVINPGTGYDPSVATAQIVSSVNPGVPYPVGAGLACSVTVDSNGAVTGVVISNGGSGYVDLSPRLIINDPGSGAATQVSVSNGSISGVSVTGGGSGYTSSAQGAVVNPVGAPGPTQSAVVSVVTNPNPHGTTPALYYQAWQNATANRILTMEMTTVSTYFKNLGYTVTQITNPATGGTFQWHICW